MCRYVIIILFIFISISVKGQILKGSITDNNKEILAGANIQIIDDAKGISADENGNYTLNLKANRSVKIQVSFIGYESRSIRIPMLK